MTFGSRQFGQVQEVQIFENFQSLIENRATRLVSDHVLQ